MTQRSLDEVADQMVQLHNGRTKRIWGGDPDDVYYVCPVCEQQIYAENDKCDIRRLAEAYLIYHNLG